MACSFDTDGFLNALTRMVAGRGWPRDMLSDNGTNFIGGSKEINQLVKEVDREKVQKMTSNKSNWHWNPPAAPHFGGANNQISKMSCQCGFRKRRHNRRRVADCLHRC